MVARRHGSVRSIRVRSERLKNTVTVHAHARDSVSAQGVRGETGPSIARTSRSGMSSRSSVSGSQGRNGWFCGGTPPLRDPPQGAPAWRWLGPSARRRWTFFGEQQSSKITLISPAVVIVLALALGACGTKTGPVGVVRRKREVGDSAETGSCRETEQRRVPAGARGKINRAWTSTGSVTIVRV